MIAFFSLKKIENSFRFNKSYVGVKIDSGIDNFSDYL